MNRTCINCEWVRGLGGPDQPGGLFCYRYPPAVVSLAAPRPILTTVWPSVRELDVCGEWAPTWKEKLRELEASTGMRRLDEQEIRVLEESLAKDRLVRPDEEGKP